MFHWRKRSPRRRRLIPGPASLIQRSIAVCSGRRCAILLAHFESLGRNFLAELYSCGLRLAVGQGGEIRRRHSTGRRVDSGQCTADRCPKAVRIYRRIGLTPIRPISPQLRTRPLAGLRGPLTSSSWRRRVCASIRNGHPTPTRKTCSSAAGLCSIGRPPQKRYWRLSWFSSGCGDRSGFGSRKGRDRIRVGLQYSQLLEHVCSTRGSTG